MIVEIPVEFKRLFDDDWREAAIYGGRYSLKSHTVARLLLIRARQSKKRIACFREFQNSIAESSHQLLADLIKQYELTDFQVTNNAIINTVNGSDFIFKGLDHNEQSIKSIEGIDIAWVEEAQTVSKSSLEVLTPTIRKSGSQIIYTYNRLMEDDPVHQRLVVEGRPNTLVIKVDYNVALKYGWMPEVVRLEMEDDKAKRPGLFKHKWLGEPISQDQKIYNNWQIIDEIPFGARLERYGLDFGYTNDPSVIVALYYYNGGYIVDEILFQKGMSNKQLADTLLNQKKALTIADAAEPKSIDEIRSYGVNIQPANKGQGSVLQGIQAVQNQDISITKRSINVIKEYRNYLWQTDKDGRIINEPEHLFSHCFAPETIIATTKGKYRIDKLVGQEGFLYSKNGFIKRFYNVRPTRLNAEMVSLTFDDGDTLTVTPDHLLLLPNGEWIEAGLLCLEDMIQSATHETNLRWSRVYSILWRKILQGLLAWKKRVFAPSDLAELLWRYTYGLSYSPQGRQQGEQFNYQLGTKTQNQAFERTYDTGETSLAEKMDRDNSSPRKQVARVKRGAKVSLVAWQEKLGRTQTAYQKLCSLPQRISNANQSLKRQILWPELQNESPTKKIKGISRGFCPVTYNLEVEDTHCLLANGVIAHNSMDSIRYALNSVAPLIQRQEMIANMPRYEIKPKPNPAR